VIGGNVTEGHQKNQEEIVGDYLIKMPTFKGVYRTSMYWVWVSSLRINGFVMEWLLHYISNS